MTPLPRCPICMRTDATYFTTANDIEYFTTADSFSFYRCDACEILFIDPMPVDRLSEIYPKNYYSFHASSADSLALRIKRFLDTRTFKSVTRNLHGNQLSALDVGGGSGWLLDGLKRAEPRISYTAVVDIDPGAEAAARAGGHDFHLTTIGEFQTERRFDLILMLNLIEHVPDPIELLKKARGLLAPKGRIWIKTPNFDSLDARIFKNRSWGGFHTPRHFVIFTKESLMRHSREAGLKVLECGYTQGAPFWTVSVINELRLRGYTDVSAQRPSIENPLAPLFQAGFAAFDFARMAFAKTSQVNIHLALPD